jgi:hypothetical protein
LVTVGVSWCALRAEHEWRITATGRTTVSSSNLVAAGVAAGAMRGLYARAQEPNFWALVLRLGKNVLCITEKYRAGFRPFGFELSVCC